MATSVKVRKTSSQDALRWMAGCILDVMEAVLAWMRRWTSPADVLGRNLLSNPYWKPIHEEIHAVQLQVVGEVPACLRGGAYLRNGPNAAHQPVASMHLFDGDGMVHAVRFHEDGGAAYANHFVRTERWKVEANAGKALLLKIGDLTGVWGLVVLAINKARHKLQIIPKCERGEDLGSANTSLIWHAARVLALHEGDVPYAIRVLCDGALQTLGALQKAAADHPLAQDAFMALPHVCTAHPKRDPRNGELLTFGYRVENKPFLEISLVSKEGKTLRSVPVEIQEPVMMHDCAMTDKYFILLDCPLVFDPKLMVTKGTLPFEMRSRNTKIGLVCREALRNGEEIEIKWMELPPCFIFHTVNAWDAEDGSVVMYVCRFETFNLGGFKGQLPQLYRFNLDPKTGSASQKQCLQNDLGLDFPKVHDGLLGLPTKYAYFVRVGKLFADPGEASSSLVKVDLQHCQVVGEVGFGPGFMVGEGVFVPCSKPTSEDDGYLLSFVTDDEEEESFLAIVDARTMSEKPVAKVRIPHRVPMGFHGLYITKEEFDLQKNEGGGSTTRFA